MEGTMAHVVETIVREAYDAFAEQAADRLFGFLAEDVRLHLPGRGPLAGTYEGRHELSGLFGQIAELTGGTFELEVQHVLADYGFAVVLVLAVAERAGQVHEGQDVHVWRIAKGKLAEVWIRPEDQYATDAFFSPSADALPGDSSEASPSLHQAMSEDRGEAGQNAGSEGGGLKEKLKDVVEGAKDAVAKGAEQAGDAAGQVAELVKGDDDNESITAKARRVATRALGKQAAGDGRKDADESPSSAATKGVPPEAGR